MEIVNDTQTLSSFDVERTNLTSVLGQSETFWFNDPCRSFEFFFCTIVIGSLCLIGLVGNTVSVVVLGSDRQNIVATFLLQALAIADNSVLVVSFVALSAVLGPFQIPSTRPILQQIIPYLKTYVNPFGLITQSCTIWITVLLAINRYIAVCRPFAAGRLLTMTLARVQVAVVVTLSVAVNIPRFFLYDVVYLTQNNVTIPRKQLTDLGNNVSFDIGYFNVFYNVVVLVLPLVVLVVFNTKIICDLRISRSNMQRNSSLYLGHQERNITIVMLIIILQVSLFHLPDRVVTAVKIVELHRDPYIQCPGAIIYASHVTNLLVILNSSTDFFIYCIFRQRFRRIFCFRFCCCGGEKGGGDSNVWTGAEGNGSVRERRRHISPASNTIPLLNGEWNNNNKVICCATRQTSRDESHNNSMNGCPRWTSNGDAPSNDQVETPAF